MNKDTYSDMKKYLKTYNDSKRSRAEKKRTGKKSIKELEQNLSKLELLPPEIHEEILTKLSLSELCSANLNDNIIRIQKDILLSGIRKLTIDCPFMLSRLYSHSKSFKWSNFKKCELIDMFIALANSGLRAGVYEFIERLLTKTLGIKEEEVEEKFFEEKYLKKDFKKYLNKYSLKDLVSIITEIEKDMDEYVEGGFSMYMFDLDENVKLNNNTLVKITKLMTKRDICTMLEEYYSWKGN